MNDEFSEFLIAGIVELAHIIDDMLGGTAVFRTVAIMFYVGNKGITIIENADKLKVPIPKFLHGKFLAFMKDNERQKTKDKAT